MESLREMLLIIGIIFISSYSIMVSQQSVDALQKMNQSIQMMFVKS